MKCAIRLPSDNKDQIFYSQFKSISELLEYKATLLIIVG